MTVEECNKAAAARTPVIANDVKYGRISAVIKKFSSPLQIERGAESFMYLVELEDVNGHSVTYTRPELVEKFVEIVDK